MEDQGVAEDGMVEHKAKALSVLSLLQQFKLANNPVTANTTTTVKSMVEVYLECAEMQIQYLFATSLKQVNQNGM
jgi:hypothetical protein